MRKARTLLLLLLVGGVGWWVVDRRWNPPLKAASGENPVAGGSLSNARLRAAVSVPSAEDARVEVRALFSKWELGEFQRYRKQVEDFSEALSEDGAADVEHAWVLTNELYLRWGELAPQEALDFIADHDGFWAGRKAAVFHGWARRHPEAAMKAYHPDLEDEYSRELEEAVLEGLSEADPAQALRFADAREYGHGGTFDPPDLQEWYRPYRENGLSEFLDLVPTEIPADPLGRSLHEWMRRDPNEVLEALLDVDYDLLRFAGMGALFSRWVAEDAEAALVALGGLKDRELREASYHQAMKAHLLHDPRQAFEWIVVVPAGVRAPDSVGGEFFADEIDDTLPYRFHGTIPTITLDWMGLVSEAGVALGFLEGRAAWDRALGIEDAPVRLAALGGVLAGWMLFDQEEASSFAREGIHRGFTDQVPGENYPRYAACLVGKMLAESSLEKAIAWTESLPPGPVRERSVTVTAEVALSAAWDSALAESSPDGWVRPEVFRRVQQRELEPIENWLLSLPPSEGRDGGLSWLVFQLRDHDDVTKALKLVTLIGDSRLRRLGFESVAHELMDPERGLRRGIDLDQWCEDHPEHADELRKALSKEGD